MNAAKSTRCLFCKVLPEAAPKAQPVRRRKFHSSAPTAARGKPAYPNVKAVDLGLIQKRIDETATGFKPYTAREKQLLALKYTPEQLRAIEAGERAIDPKDLAAQSRVRTDTMGAIDYLDDMSKIHPFIDKPVRAPDSHIDPKIRPRTQDELLTRFANFHKSLEERQRAHMEKEESMTEEQQGEEIMKLCAEKGVYPGDGLEPRERMARLKAIAEAWEGPDAMVEWSRFISNADNFFHSPKGKINSQSDSLAPAVPKFKTPGIRYTNEEEDPHMERLCQQTGMTKEDIRKIRIKNLVAHRVVNQTRMGKIQSLYWLTIAGNENGMLGIGEGKAAESEDGMRQAMMAAIRNMKPIPRYENRTIFGEVEGKVGASVVQLSSRPPGTYLPKHYLIQNSY